MIVIREDDQFIVTMDAAEHEAFAAYIRTEKECLDPIKHHPKYRAEYTMLEQLDHELTYPRRQRP